MESASRRDTQTFTTSAYRSSGLHKNYGTRSDEGQAIIVLLCIAQRICIAFVASEVDAISDCESQALSIESLKSFYKDTASLVAHEDGR